jgi:hypothetical protein
MQLGGSLMRMIATRAGHYLRALSAVAAVGLGASSSEAHFILASPPATLAQSDLGDPQKAPPCGDNGSGVPTGIVTTFQQGQTITVTIEETVFHPGHYRIALAVNDVSELPPEPIVTPGATPCGSAPIMDPPVFPVLADGVFEHTAPLSGPQSIDITLPDDVTCDHCVLQIIQFMSDHALNDPGGCYYHHCAEIALQEEPVMTTSSTTTSGSGGAGGDTSGAGGAGANGGGPSYAPYVNPDEGCSCAVPGSSGGSAPLALGSALALALTLLRRRPLRRRQARGGSGTKADVRRM